jgi:hypothetical protein
VWSNEASAAKLGSLKFLVSVTGFGDNTQIHLSKHFTLLVFFSKSCAKKIKEI